MSHVLVIAEKPSVARDIARVLGCRQKGENCLVGEQYIVTWALGHLVSLKEPEELDEKYKRWNAGDLPILPSEIGLKVLPKTRTQFSSVKKLMNSQDVTSLVCATDAGREGELIFRYIYSMAKCQKPFQRLWISSLTDEAIKQGFQALEPGSKYDALYESAKCRSEADWLIGMNATRAFTLRYDALLSVGRVQTPTLSMLVKRRKEIDHFKPENYFQLEATFTGYKGLWFDPVKDTNRISTEEEAAGLQQKVLGKPVEVTEIIEEPKSELPPQLFDLTSLQRTANQLFGFTAKKTLDTAQALYEKHKLITYPRTDSRCLSDDMKPVVTQLFRNMEAPYSDYTPTALTSSAFSGKRVFNNAKLTDHHALIPTAKKPDFSKLSDSEAKLYDLIVRRLLKAFYPERKTVSQRVITVSEGESFLSTGVKVLQEGFSQIPDSGFTKTTAKAQPDLSSCTKGMQTTVKKAEIKSQQTQPPKEYTDASLLSAMEYAGRNMEESELEDVMKGFSLGTPATRAAIIERLVQVGYAVRKGKQISATPKGVQLIDVVPEAISSPLITGKWEYALEKIAAGTGDAMRFLEGIRNMSAYLVQNAAGEAPAVQFDHERPGTKKRKKAASTLGISCPFCHKGTVAENSKGFYCTEWKNGCKFTVWKDSVVKLGGPEITEKILKALLSSESGDLKGSTGILHFHDGKTGFTPNKNR